MGRPHGLDGSFHVAAPGHALAEGTVLTIAGDEVVVERRAGTAERPLVRVSGTGDRDAAAALRGESMLVAESEPQLADGEWLAADLIGCRIEGLGEVRRVVAAPSCDVLEVGEEGVLIPFITLAIRSIDPIARSIEVDRGFLALDPPAADAGRAEEP